MVAAPQYASFTFVGSITGKTYTKDAYMSDVANALVRFDAGAGASATSPDHYRAPEPVILTDFANVTGMTDTTKIQLIRNGTPTGDILRFVPHLTTNALRPRLRIGIKAGVDFQAIQLA